MKAVNPRSGQTDYEFSSISHTELVDSCRMLRKHQIEWAALSVDQRCDCLMQWREEIIARHDEITAALCADTGRYLMAVVEVDSVIERIRYWCEHAPGILQAAEVSGQSDIAPSCDFSMTRVPYPLVGVISPWNVPLILGLIDAIPALLAGCSVVIKPSEITPRFADPLKQSVAAVPALSKVLDIVLGAADTGRALVNSVDAICFTGSVPTGRKVAVAAAEAFIPAFLELGGKDPAIVCDDADLHSAATAILRSAAGLTGQTCQSTERVYVHNKVLDEFLDDLVKQAKSTRLNYPDLHSGHIGPFIFAAQAETVAEQIAEAVERGATVHCGGEVKNLDGGWYCEATVLSKVDHRMSIMREETFGPVIPVMGYDEDEEAIELANNSVYGLSAAVFSRDLERAAKIARRINVGAIGINDASMTAGVHDVEKNSFGYSGMGASRMGATGLLRFLRHRALLLQTGPVVPLDVFREENASN